MSCNILCDQDILSIDNMPQEAALSAMLDSHIQAAEVLRTALESLETAAQRIAQGLHAGNVLHYAAAGSSGLMALADASELAGTFGIDQSQIVMSMAGGVPVNAVMPGDVEDDPNLGREAAQKVNAGDICIVLSASGSTPYALAYVDAAIAKNACVIGIANKEDSELLARAQVAVALPTAPEVVEGSTRLGAGTAQKLALNIISTRAGILMGHVHNGLMVNFKPENIKLRKRAEDVVCKITGVSHAKAKNALEQSKYDTKVAVLIALGVPMEEARARLFQVNGNLTEAMSLSG